MYKNPLNSLWPADAAVTPQTMAKAMTGNRSTLASVLQRVVGLDSASLALLLEGSRNPRGPR